MRPQRVLILTLGGASSFATCGSIGFRCSTSCGVADMISRAAVGTISGTGAISSSSSNVIDSGVARICFEFRL